MRKFKFKGDWWNSTIELVEFDKRLNNKKYSFRRNELDKGEYLLIINDIYDKNPDLSVEQIQTIEHLQIQNNQIKIIENLFEYLKDIVYPEYQEYISEEEYPGTFPTLNEVKDLNQVIGLDHIVVLRFGTQNFNYYNLMFETSLDEEHGIGFVMHENEIIEHGDIGGLGYEKVAEHLGMKYEEYLKYQTSIQTPLAKEYQIPNEKFGTLKPWQKEFNDNYNYYLWSNGTSKELIEFIDSEKIPLEKSFKQIRPHMIRENRTELIEYFKSKGYK